MDVSSPGHSHRPGLTQGMDLWLGLESCLQGNEADDGRQLVVFAGPIFGDTNPSTAAPALRATGNRTMIQAAFIAGSRRCWLQRT